ncbi:hypothetical protein BHM03_00012116 [Ensete ventricosum]|nr:hypothetical protein BHM03_00012116 [Ensete ventricosum]
MLSLRYRLRLSPCRVCKCANTAQVYYREDAMVGWPHFYISGLSSLAWAGARLPLFLAIVSYKKGLSRAKGPFSSAPLMIKLIAKNLYKGCHKRLAVVACSRGRTRGGRMRVKAASSDGHVRVEATQAATARWQPSRPSDKRAGRGRTGVVTLAATTMSA